MARRPAPRPPLAPAKERAIPLAMVEPEAPRATAPLLPTDGEGTLSLVASLPVRGAAKPAWHIAWLLGLARKLVATNARDAAAKARCDELLTEIEGLLVAGVDR